MIYSAFKFSLYTLLLLVNLLITRGIAMWLLPDVAIHPVSKYLWQIVVYLLIFFYLRLLTRRMVTTSETWLILKGSLIALVINFALLSLLKQSDQYSRFIILTFFSLNLLLPIWIFYLKRWVLRYPLLREKVMVICDELACETSAQWLANDNPFGFDAGEVVNINHYSPEGLESVVARLLEENRFFATLMILENTDLNRMFSLMDHLQHKMKRIFLIPRMTLLPMFNAEVFNSINHKGLIFAVRNNLLSNSDRAFKRISDSCLAVVLIIGLAPFLLGLYLWVWIATKGHPIFKQKRIGQYGKVFKIYKFRTMRLDAAEQLEQLLETDEEAREEWERDRKLKNDPRITQIGHFLRKTSLDELPQLINVVRGQMSLVGPRPIVAEEIVAYGEYIDYYQQVKPGITGLWQVSGRNELSYGERVQMDVWYVRNWSLELDLIILTKTVVAVLLRKGSY